MEKSPVQLQSHKHHFALCRLGKSLLLLQHRDDDGEHDGGHDGEHDGGHDDGHDGGHDGEQDEHDG